MNLRSRYFLITIFSFTLFNCYTSDKPSNPNKTPLSPSIIEHYKTLYPTIVEHWKIWFTSRSFHRARIYFGTNKEGNPSFQSIQEHEKNSDFSHIKVAITDNFNFKTGSVSLKLLGEYGNESVKQELIKSMSSNHKHSFRHSPTGNGGVWCPQQNAFIGGTRNTSLCDRFEQDFINSKKRTY